MTFVKEDPQFISYHSLVFECRRKQHGGIVHGDALFYNSFAEAFELCLTVGISQVEQSCNKMKQLKESLKKLPLAQSIYKSAFSLFLFSRRCECTKRAGVFNRFCRRHSLSRLGDVRKTRDRQIARTKGSSTSKAKSIWSSGLFPQKMRAVGKESPLPSPMF